jgi:hypothetical protein
MVAWRLNLDMPHLLPLPFTYLHQILLLSLPKLRLKFFKHFAANLQGLPLLRPVVGHYFRLSRPQLIIICRLRLCLLRGMSLK